MRIFLGIALLAPFAAGAAPTYTIEGEWGEQKLAVADGSAKGVWADEGYVSIQQQADFNGDGTLDALVLSSCGGNGCATAVHFATLKDGKLTVAPIGETWGEARTKSEKGQWFIELDASGGTEVFVITGLSPTPYATTKRPVLKALAEVHGMGSPETEGPDRTLTTDVDLDGKPDTIRCTVWARWGSLLCELPVAGGVQKLGTGCDRFGALPTTANGRREFVCNEDAIVRFDGKAWVEPKLP